MKILNNKNRKNTWRQSNQAIYNIDQRNKPA